MRWLFLWKDFLAWHHCQSVSQESRVGGGGLFLQKFSPPQQTLAFVSNQIWLLGAGLRMHRFRLLSVVCKRERAVFSSVNFLNPRSVSEVQCGTDLSLCESSYLGVEQQQWLRSTFNSWCVACCSQEKLTKHSSCWHWHELLLLLFNFPTLEPANAFPWHTLYYCIIILDHKLYWNLSLIFLTCYRKKRMINKTKINLWLK